jgi:ATP-dependent Clp protease ATP-binding subunit ClpA
MGIKVIKQEQKGKLVQFCCPRKGRGAMYDRFTDRARKVLEFAKQEAQRLEHQFLGTEHILLGLAKEGSGVAANVLKNLDIDLQKIRLEVEKMVPGPISTISGRFPQTPRAKKVIEFAIDEARRLTHKYVGTEHLLLGLLREQEGAGAQVLMNMGLRLDLVRQEVLKLLGPAMQVRGESLPLPEVDVTKLPEEVQRVVATFDQLIEQLGHFKETAVAVQDFVKAANIRDQQDEIKKVKARFIRMWSTSS